MKNFKKLLLSIASVIGISASAHADYIRVFDLNPDTYIDGEPVEVGQIDLTGIGDVGVFEGSVSTIYPLGSYGFRYELYSVITEGGEDKVYFLYSSVVGPYPTVEFETYSVDPFEEFRTRADRPFRVAVKASNFNPAPEAPISLKQLRVDHVKSDYAYDKENDVEEFFFSTTYPENWENAKDDDYALIEAEGRYVLTAPEEAIAGEDSESAYSLLDSYETYLLDAAIADANADGVSPNRDDLARGEERFVISARPREDAPWVVITEKRIRVFPHAQAAIRGSNDSFANSFMLDEKVELLTTPSLMATCKNLYPESTTQLKVYRGVSDAGELVAISDDVIVASSEPQSFNTLVPQNGILTINASDMGALTDGLYFAQVETTTNLDGGRTDALPGGQVFLIGSSIQINANISTSE